MGNTPHLVASAGHASLLGSALGGYQVQALIGRGAMGTVYLARDTALNRPIALKVLLGSLARNPAMVRSFYREAQAAAPLRHPGIVRIYSAGVESGTPYIAMEYVAGEPLDRFLRRKGSVSWQAALHVGAQLAQALNCAHGAGVVHRDVKPANILLDRQGRVRLADFGIARVATLDARGGRPGGVMGTPTYMSPEQCEGLEPGPATDLYSLGVVLYQMMAGNPPFRAETPQALVKQILTDDAPRLNKLDGEIPDDVARLVAHLLQKEPGARPKSAAHVARMIDRIRAEEGGRSVVPEALSAFVREQAVESNLRLMTPVPQHRVNTPKRSLSRKGYSRRVAAICMVVVASILTLVVLSRSTARGAIPAPPLAAFRFSQEPGGVLASAVMDGFTFQRIHWAGKTLLVEAQGQAGSLLHGATGLLSLIPESQEGFSIYAPNPPVSSPPAPWLPVSLSYRLPIHEHGPLANSVLMFRTVNTGAEEVQHAILFSQPVDSAVPAPTPLFEGALAPCADSGETSEPRFAVALHPDGERFCAALKDEHGGTYLAEINLYGNAWSETRLTPACPAVVPGSVQYTPDGNRIAYMRESADGMRELWLIRRTEDGAGVPIAVGRLDAEYAIGPDGTQLVLGAFLPDDDAPELRLIDTESGEVLSRPGRGWVGSEAWLPSGNAFVASWGEPLQAHLVYADGVTPPEHVTELKDGILGRAAVSPDGAWIAVVAKRRSDRSLLFLRAPRTSARVAQAVSATTVNS